MRKRQGSTDKSHNWLQIDIIKLTQNVQHTFADKLKTDLIMLKKSRIILKTIISNFYFEI
jgi:hypothetical protein